MGNTPAAGVWEPDCDRLTGLVNRGRFLELLEQALEDAALRNESVAVLFIDLDRFRRINDTLGHAAGDALLQEAAARLNGLLGADEVAGRVAGDEFAIVLRRQPNEGQASERAREYCRVLRKPYGIEGEEWFVTASLGLALFPQHGRRAGDLLHNADHAMCRAKRSGRNALEVFTPENHGIDQERRRLENALHRALVNDEFDLLYQPVVNMSGAVDGLEALLSWKHPVHGAISPQRFIPIAEESGLIVPIGNWVLERVCRDGAGWRAAGRRKVSLSLNVSALQFERSDFVASVAGALASSGFPPACLELELTESSVMGNLPEAARRLAEARGLGVRIAIDDFGTGYSSLSYLNELPVDTLKIDQSFLRRLQQPAGTLPVVQSIVRLAHGLNLTVVAEGVETREELDLVRVLGCDRVQGHVYGPALASDQVEALLAQGKLLPVDFRAESAAGS